MVWESRKLAEEKALDKRKIISVSLNLEEISQLNKIKEGLRLDNESTALKLCFDFGKNVIHHTLGIENLDFLLQKYSRFVKKRRDR